MYLRDQASLGYGAGQSPVRSPRSIEFQVFAQVTSRLKKARQSDNAADLAKAVYDNRKLWTAIAADIASPGNQLPENLKAQIFYLAEFTFAHSAKVLRKQAPIDVLIDINRSIMSGLNGVVDA